MEFRSVSYSLFLLFYYNLIKTEKQASRTKVIEMFPNISSKLSKKKDNNKADAILIAQYFENIRENKDN